jgi:hypothetical protein
VAPVGREPLVELAEGTGVEAVQALLSIDAGDNHAGLAQAAKVLGDPRLAQAHLGDEFADGRFAVAQDVQDLAAMRFGEDGEGDRHATT